MIPVTSGVLVVVFDAVAKLQLPPPLATRVVAIVANNCHVPSRAIARPCLDFGGKLIGNRGSRRSELCSENALLDLSVTEMQMREKGKADELERIRQENEQLRKETYHNRAENHQLKRDKQVI